MFASRTGTMLYAAFCTQKRLVATFSMDGNDVCQIASLPPKKLGKIALDVARCGGSDIRIWKTFVDSCTGNVESFDSKDTLRIWKAVGSFYRNYNHKLREPDVKFIIQLLLHSQTVCNGYTCDQLSQLAEIVCDFSVANGHLIEITTSLFSNIAVLFNIRLAEAMPYGVVRLLVAFSRLGIRDPYLMDSLSTFICNYEGFTVHDLRTVLMSCALMDYRSLELLKHATDQFLLLSEVGINDLAILSFVYSTLDYRTDEVISLFRRHLDGMSATPEIGDQPAEGHALDWPSFCLFLNSLGVSIPEHVIRYIEVHRLSRDAFFKVVHLLPCWSGIVNLKLMGR
ncbi:hypothetical protein X943_002642 [Babesia divergens]|uniref:Uncharacterized protein n=1 Tax=Babesia divergens TaxID=32595 RepID=A0AAD9GLD2_BABDI|nr:hypothetical protein X943_002642 [Babesia divergens]